jgi:sulfatase modifying factor 1
MPPPPPVDASAPPSPIPKCPDEMALVPVDNAFVCVDRYEGAVEGAIYSHAFESESDVGRAIVAKGIKPQVNIDEHQAYAACEASSKRLCTEAEWVTACRGPDHTLYPYGNTHEKGACNEGKLSPVSSSDLKRGTLDLPRLAEAKNGMMVGGAFPKCQSAFGVFDMHGNAHEWVSTSPKPEDSRYGEFLGGFYADASLNGEGCTYKTVAHFKNYHDYSTGFRCCKDAIAK